MKLNLDLNFNELVTVLLVVTLFWTWKNGQLDGSESNNEIEQTAE
jgi:hypothetical protein